VLLLAPDRYFSTRQCSICDSTRPLTIGFQDQTIESRIYLIDPQSNQVWLTERNGKFGTTNGLSGVPTLNLSASPGTNAPPGTTVTFTAAVNGAAPLFYQWYKNGASLTSATNSTLTFSNVTYTNSGTYSVLVMNSFGSVSNSIRFVVNHRPSAYAQSVIAIQNITKTITLNASDEDKNPLTYTILTNPVQGTLTGSNKVYNYTPNTNYV